MSDREPYPRLLEDPGTEDDDDLPPPEDIDPLAPDEDVSPAPPEGRDPSVERIAEHAIRRAG